MFSRHYRKVKGIFALTDSILTSLAFVAAYQTRIRLHFERVFHFVFYIDLPIAALLLIVSVLCWLAIGYWFNIYEKLDSAHPRVVLRDTFRQCVLGAICLVVAEYMLRLDLSRFFVVLFATYAWILLCLFRINASRLIGAVRKKFGTEHFVLVVGSSESARHLGEALEHSWDYGIRLIGFLDEKAGQVQLSQTYQQYPLWQLPHLLHRLVVDEIIFAVDNRQLGSMEEVFLLCDEEGVRTRVVVDFFPHVNSRISVDSLGTTPLLTFSATPHDEIRLAIHALRCIVDPVDLARSRDLPTGAVRAQRPAIRPLQVPLHVRQRRRA
jgi:FlaA1/EpsC-like NDP-sugar epimerase